MQIKEDDLSGADIRKLLTTHFSDAQHQNPKGLSHALDIQALKHPNISFWSVWDDEALMGCGALRELSSELGEIKSVHTHTDHRRKGVSTYLMQHIIEVGRDRGYESIKLETHPTDAYAAARALYERLGFDYCGPFGLYEVNPNSVFMCLDLSETRLR